jgi:hypothetical protein
VTFRTLPPPYARNGKNSPQDESQVEALELSYPLTMLKNDSKNLIFGYMISYDYCCHHHMNANELWLYMIALVIILSKILALCLIKARISDGGTHAQLSQRVQSDR